MITGIIAGWLVSLGWIAWHLVRMHLRPAANRFKSMFLGYLLSLPFPALTCLLLSAWPELPGWARETGPLALALLHAYLWHLLLFFAYAEFFYMVERSVTLRFLTEILRRPLGQAQLDQIQADYNAEQMIQRRLRILEENNFSELRDGKWCLKPKGRRLAQAMRVSAWIYQSAGQSDRL
jgi:hypothetical protein